MLFGGRGFNDLGVYFSSFYLFIFKGLRENDFFFIILLKRVLQSSVWCAIFYMLLQFKEKR